MIEHVKVTIRASDNATPFLLLQRRLLILLAAALSFGLGIGLILFVLTWRF